MSFLCVELQNLLIISTNSNAFQGQLSMEGIDFDQLITRESDCEILPIKRPTKAPRKEKALKCIMDFVHLSSLTSSYNHHFMFYGQDIKNVTQLVPNHVWKVIYVNYKLKFLDFVFQEESLKDKL
jgi:hypothetical protein